MSGAHRIQDLAVAARGRGLDLVVEGDASVLVRGVSIDSRSVREGDLFCAVGGTHTDGAGFLADAATRGAVAFVCARDADCSGLPGDGVAVLRAANPRRATGVLASLFYGDPSHAMDVVGVTGTNGKTSTCYLIESIACAARRRPGVLGTIATRWPGHDAPSSLTTPPATELQATLARMRAAGCDLVAMEVSSHALDQRRVEGTRFRVGVFSNLTRDHLDYHGDEESYFRAKALLFREYLERERPVAVLNADDERVRALAGEMHHADVWLYSLDPDSRARVHVVEAAVDLDGIDALVDLDGHRLRVNSRMIGAPNLSNILAAASVAAALGIAPDDIARGIADCGPVPGRLERVGHRDPCVLVDYAHTPDALARTLEAAARHTRGRLLCVFGCGGDRDRGKRPMMGDAVARLAGAAVVTSDNPRTEDPRAILDEIVAGMGGAMEPIDADGLAAGADGYVVEVDRRRAIRMAVAAAGADDVVVVAGKGHETYQDEGGRRSAFDDRVEVAAALEARNGR